MDEIKEKIESISKIADDLTNTAKDVNRDSHERKSTCANALVQIDKLMDKNKVLILNFYKIFHNLDTSNTGIENNSEEFRSNVEFFESLINKINQIKDILSSLENEIEKLQRIVNEIRDDTDEIFTLALNASIVSSKYSHTSGVFDILANKLDEMSNYINQNLDNIVEVVKPITDGIQNLKDENTAVLADFEGCHTNFMEFPRMLDNQKNSVNELQLRADMTDNKIKHQKKMIEDISDKFVMMEKDASDAIRGSGNVIKLGEDLKNEVNRIIFSHDEKKDYMDKITMIKVQSNSIWNTATRVNEKSKSQLDFSMNCLEFCDSIISQTGELRDTAKNFNDLSIENSKTAEYISQNLITIISQMKTIETNIGKSNETVRKFNVDYKEIDSILEFLKNILKSMKIIGMLSRIESSRDPEEFQGFMTISENIGKLQDKIQNNIPLIEANIQDTHNLISRINEDFEKSSSDFTIITKISNSTIENLKKITKISTDSAKISNDILSEGKTLESMLEELRGTLNTLIEIVKKPIAGSAANIGRGKNIQEACVYILDYNKEHSALETPDDSPETAGEEIDSELVVKTDDSDSEMAVKTDDSDSETIVKTDDSEVQLVVTEDDDLPELIPDDVIDIEDQTEDDVKTPKSLSDF